MFKMFGNSHRKRSGYSGEWSQNYEHLKEKSAEQLTDELAELIEAAANGHCDMASIDAHLDALDEIDPLPFEFDVKASYNSFMSKHAVEMEREATRATVANVSAPRKKHSQNIRRLATLAAVAAVLICTLVLANSVNTSIFDAIAQWTSGVFGFEKEASFATIKTNPLAEGEEASYDSLQEALDAFGITAPLNPQCIPERFELDTVTAANKAGGISICAYYVAEDGYVMLQYNESDGADFRDLERENGVTSLYDYDGFSHFIVADEDREKAYWQNGELECCLSGNVSKEELKEIINSIYKENEELEVFK